MDQKIEIPELKIFLNIYDLNKANDLLMTFGLGAYHTGVQFFDTEFAFGYHDGSQTGVYESEPKKSFQGKFRESISLGTCHLSIEDVLDVIEELKSEYIGNSYNIFTKNCNHFTNDLCLKLVNKSIPCYINRLATITYYIRCLIPKSCFTAKVAVPVRPTRSKHRKKDSINLNSKRIKNKKTGPMEGDNDSQVERLSLANNDEKREHNMV